MTQLRMTLLYLRCIRNYIFKFEKVFSNFYIVLLRLHERSNPLGNFLFHPDLTGSDGSSRSATFRSCERDGGTCKVHRCQSK